MIRPATSCAKSSAIFPGLAEPRRRLPQKNSGARGAASGADAAVPTEKSHFLLRTLRYDDDNRLWILTERGGLDSSVFDVFAANGAWLGEVRVPERMRRFALGSGLLASVTFDADEAQYVSVYRVTG